MGWKFGNAIVLLEMLYFKLIFIVEYVMEVIGLFYLNVNKLVKDFCDVGLLEEIIG